MVERETPKATTAIDAVGSFATDAYAAEVRNSLESGQRDGTVKRHYLSRTID